MREMWIRDRQIADYRENVAPLVYVIRQNVFLNADASAHSEINKLLMQYICLLYTSRCV